MSDRRTFITQLAISAIGVGSRSSAASSDEISEISAHADSPRLNGRISYRIPQTELTVSRIAYGCASLVSWDRNPVSGDELTKASHAIHTAYDNGVTLFDHADIYAFGKSETVFGEILRQSPGLRNRIVIQSKCGQRLTDMWKPGDPIYADLSRQHVVSSAEATLRRLGTDYLDLLLLHVPDPLMRPEEISQAFEDLRRHGKVRYFGVSNYNSTQLALLKKTVKEPLVVNQIQLGLAHALPIADGMNFTLEIGQGLSGDLTGVGLASAGTLDYCRMNDVQIQAWSPLRGVVTPTPDAAPERIKTAQLLSEIARARDTTPSAVAIAWLLYHPASIVPIIGPLEAEHIVEDCSADRVTLSREEWYRLFYATINLKPLLV